MKRTLAWAYEYAPGVGSEAGSGWVWARMLAGFSETWVMTSPYPPRADVLESHIRDVPEGRHIQIVYVDIPRWMRRILGQPRGSRLERLEYVLWQFAALRASRRLHRLHSFDLIWHLTWANVWIGSLACRLGPTFVFGPVGGGVNPPWRLVPALGARGAAHEAVRAFARIVARHFNPLGHLTWSRARLILVQNPETREWLPKRHRAKTFVFPNAVLEEATERRSPGNVGPSAALFAGRLLPLKGASFAIEAMALLPGWRLIVCGAGPDERRLRELTHRLLLNERIGFRGWQPREEVLRLMRDEAHVLLFPSLHDEGSWVVAEAVACGLPVVCLDRGGPAVLAGGGVAATTPGATVQRLAAAVLSAEARPLVAPRTDLASSRSRLTDLLRRAGLLSEVAGTAE